MSGIIEMYPALRKTSFDKSVLITKSHVTGRESYEWKRPLFDNRKK
jgi:hypothetical protein